MKKILQHFYWYGYIATFIISFHYSVGEEPPVRIALGLVVGLLSWGAVIAEIVEKL